MLSTIRPIIIVPQMSILGNESFVMAARLKDLREEKGLSHDKLSLILQDQYGIKISSDSLMNYEVSDSHHSKARKNQGMRVEYLRCLADFYNVASDYILGLTDVKNPNPTIAKICEHTGLSEQAVSELAVKKITGLGTGLDIILETPNASLLIYGLEKYYYDMIAAYILENNPQTSLDGYPPNLMTAICTRRQYHNATINVISTSGIEFLTVSDMYAAKVTHLLTNTLRALANKAKEDSRHYFSDKSEEEVDIL